MKHLVLSSLVPFSPVTRYTARRVIAKELAPHANAASPQGDPRRPAPARAEPTAAAGHAAARQPWLVARQNWLRSARALFGGEGRRVCLSTQEPPVCVAAARGRVQHPGVR